MKKIATTLRTLAAATLVAIGTLAASSASAAPTASVFTVDASVINPANSSFQATQISGSSTTRLVKTGNYTYDGTGFISYTGFSNGATAVDSSTSGLGNNYRMYATFTQKFTCSGPLGAPTTTCGVNQIDLHLFLDTEKNTVLLEGDLSAPYTISGNGGVTPDKEIGFVTLPYQGFASVNPLLGAQENVNTDFNLTAFGQTFFVDPNPFFKIAFSAFINDTSGLACSNATCVDAATYSITGETGTTRFPVPEPASLALFGMALAGIATARRRKSK